MKKFLALLASCLLASPACAWDTPSKAVSEFLLFELNGGRLSSDRWLEYTTKYIASFEGYDEPGWDRATVVSRYKIRDLNCATESSCEASVLFTLYPTRKLRELIVVPHRNGGTMVKRYFMVKKDDSWLIKPIEPSIGSPIISIETYRRHLAELDL